MSRALESRLLARCRMLGPMASDGKAGMIAYYEFPEQNAKSGAANFVLSRSRWSSCNTRHEVS
jgi:hypothetical protein